MGAIPMYSVIVTVVYSPWRQQWCRYSPVEEPQAPKGSDVGRGSLFPLERSYVTSLYFLIFLKFRNDLLRTPEEKVDLGWARGSLHEFLRQLYPVLPRGFSAVAAILAVV